MAAGVAVGVEAIAWDAPWLAPWRATGPAVALQWLRGGTVHDALGWAPQAVALSVRFAPQSSLLEGAAYEQHIFETRCVPTRDNLHDFFNGLVWLAFPEAKQRLNQLQAQAIATDGVQAVRGPLRDALTVFDENGALLDAPPALWHALQARDWHRLFVDLRPLWSQARLVVFGHALLEKLVTPRKSMVAHVYQAQAALEFTATLDAWLAQELQPQRWATKPFVPLPVLGVPGWWHANAEPAFYADSQVFRGPRTGT